MTYTEPSVADYWTLTINWLLFSLCVAYLFSEISIAVRSGHATEVNGIWDVYHSQTWPIKISIQDPPCYLSLPASSNGDDYNVIFKPQREAGRAFIHLGPKWVSEGATDYWPFHHHFMRRGENYCLNYYTFQGLFSSCVLVTQPCLILCNPMDCSPPGSSVHGILQARIQEWVAILLSRGSSRPRDWTWVSTLQAGSLPSECPSNYLTSQQHLNS